MGICYGFRSIVARVKYPGFMLLTISQYLCNICLCGTGNKPFPDTTNHYMDQCSPRSLTPYGVTWPQWVVRSYWTSRCLQKKLILGMTYPNVRAMDKFEQSLSPIWGRYFEPPRDLLASWELTWWRHQMETFSALLGICAGNSPATGDFPTQRPVTRSFMFSLICARINAWVKNC